MRLKVLRPLLGIPRIKTSLGVRPCDQISLSGRGRHRDARGSSILVHSRVANHALDLVAVGNGVAEALEDDGSYTFASSVPRRLRIPHSGSAVSCQHVKLAGTDELQWAKDHVGSCCDGYPGVTAAEKLDGLVDGHQAGRARSVDGH